MFPEFSDTSGTSHVRSGCMCLCDFGLTSCTTKSTHEKWNLICFSGCLASTWHEWAQTSTGLLTLHADGGGDCSWGQPLSWMHTRKFRLWSQSCLWFSTCFCKIHDIGCAKAKPCCIHWQGKTGAQQWEQSNAWLKDAASICLYHWTTLLILCFPHQVGLPRVHCFITHADVYRWVRWTMPHAHTCLPNTMHTHVSKDCLRTLVLSILDSRVSILDSGFSILHSGFSILDSRFSIPILLSRFLILASRFSMLDSRLWILDSNSPSSVVLSRSSILDPRCSILDSRFSILDPRFSILDSRSSILDSRSWILDSRFSILDPRFSILDPRSSILDSQFWILDSRSSILHFLTVHLCQANPHNLVCCQL